MRSYIPPTPIGTVSQIFPLPRSVLSSLSNMSQDPLDLDSVVLSLLHRHREDLVPTGQTFTSPTTPTKPTVSRSSSFRRTFNSSLPLTPGHQRQLGFADRPHSPSPLRPASPALYPIHRADSPSLGSPRVLSVAATEFLPRHSPVISATPPLPSVWSNDSPLGTPRLTPSATSYFPPQASTNATNGFGSSPAMAISRAAWGPHRDSSSSLPAISTSTSSEGSVEEPSELDLFPTWSHEQLQASNLAHAASEASFGSGPSGQDDPLFNEHDWETV